MQYLKHLVKDKKVATIASSSPITIRYLCNKIDFRKDITIVEYGPGNGCITKQLLKRMSKNSKIIAIETSEPLANELQMIPDTRLRVMNGSAEHVSTAVSEKVDYVISGIPFSMIPKDVKNNILQNTKDIIKPGGKFLVYQFDPRIRKLLKKNFSKIRSEWQPFNVPPLWIFRATN